MEILEDDGYGGTDSGTKVYYFIQGKRSIELEAVVNVICAQPKKYDKYFYATLSYLGQMITKEDSTMNSVSTAKTGSLPVKPKATHFMEKIGCKKYLKTVLDSMSREQYMQVKYYVNNKASSPW